MATSGRGRNTGLAITALCSVQFVDVLGVTVVVTALPRMLAAVAGSVVLLTAARCLQGAAAAASVPSALRLLTTLTPDGPPRRRAIAAWSAAGASVGASGFAVGGVITDLASWRLIFWAYLPLAAALAAAVVRAVPQDRGPSHSGSLNTLAAVMFTAAVM